MEHWICVTCGTQFAESVRPPERCPICEDQRQYIGYAGQQWTTLADMQKGSFRNVFEQVEPRLTSIQTKPSFAIGERALLLQTKSGNVLWDCLTLLDEETIQQVQQSGDLKAIAISHPHFYTTMVEWAEQFDATIFLHEADQQWVMRPSKRIIFWSGETYSLAEGVVLVHAGGHFAGSTMLYWEEGAEGQGAMLTGDTIQVVADRNWVTFMYSYPNYIPLPIEAVDRICERIQPYRFERIYGGWPERVVVRDAKNAVLRSADRYKRAIQGLL